MKQIALTTELAEAQQRIERIAAEFGLSYFPVVFEVVDYEQMNALAAYAGFPTRYPHYRFGMEYHQLAKSYEYGLHKIYEMVINNDPTYAYLLEGNTLLDQKLVMAHVYGHADFFCNNMYFAHTNRKMVDAMANHATRIRRYQERYGLETVERFVDACLAVEELIDPGAVFQRSDPVPTLDEEDEQDRRDRKEVPARMPAKSYLDRYVNPPEFMELQRKRMMERKQEAKRFPSSPERDVLGFIQRHAPLENWERDVLGIIREESYYFLPQRQSKVMNEGWASYWHSKIMTSRVLTDAEVVDYADHHSGTVATAPGQLNPYKLGLELFRDIERRWDRGQFGPEWELCESMAERSNWNRKLGLGREKIFEVRKIHCDATFLDEFLTPEFCAAQRLFVTKEDPRTKRPVISTREFNQIKQALLFQFTNGGKPVIELVDSNFANRSELLLRHRHVGVDLRWDWAKEVLESLTLLWRRPVRLETIRKDKPTRLGHDGENPTEESVEEVAEAQTA
jgi:stage V sporulation protein R